MLSSLVKFSHNHSSLFKFSHSQRHTKPVPVPFSSLKVRTFFFRNKGEPPQPPPSGDDEQGRTPGSPSSSMPRSRERDDLAKAMLPTDILKKHYRPEEDTEKKKIPPRLTLEGVKKIIAVASAKGGVGKSTVAVNLAVALNQLKKKVAIMDADIYGPSLPILMNLRDQKPDVNRRKMMVPMISYGIKCMSMGFLMPENSPVIWRGPMVMSALEQMLRQTDWGEVDVMVIDLPPGTGDIQLSMAQTIPVNGAVIVCTPQLLALTDAVRGVNMFRKVSIPVFGIVENMSYHICEKCKEKSYIFGQGGAQRTADQMKVDFLGEIPLHQIICETSDEGTPITVSEPNSIYAQAFKQVGEKVIKKLEDPVYNQQQKPPKIVEE